MFKILFFVAVLLLTSTLSAGTYSEKWTDFNYVPCEGIGVNGMGTVSIDAQAIDKGNHHHVSSFMMTATHPHGKHVTASIKFTNKHGKRKLIRLTQPWFPTIGKVSAVYRYLPRNKTTAIPSSKEQQDIQVAKDSQIEILVNVLYSVDGGNCSSQFKRLWKIP